MFISFITTIKICKGYEWLINSILLYIKNIEYFCSRKNITYEILICEQIDDRNIFKIQDKYDFSSHSNVKIIPLHQTYNNPFNFNLIESYGKNKCLQEASGEFTCMTSADILFDELFFDYLYSLQKNIFYRFATFEIPRKHFEDINDALDYCKNSTSKRLCNSGCFVDNPSPIQLAQKSGDIMLLDTLSFRNIKGWPETICFTHMDMATCIVATNNYSCIVPDKNVCSYTFTQEERNSQIGEKYINVNGNIISLEQFQFKVGLSFFDKKTSN